MNQLVMPKGQSPCDSRQQGRPIRQNGGRHKRYPEALTSGIWRLGVHPADPPDFSIDDAARPGI